ncbi:DUF3710 domain-containing protein [Gordonia sp. CPCC 205333]|uniref:DUF3710 domain-containing protein n=1 Tax=Gordonia sp. CPCC 205333 TaxID=3140790 RepID=UPI003AF37E54
MAATGRTADQPQTHSLGDAAGPYDIESLTNSDEDLAQSHLDLGSVLVPVVEGGQVSVEMTIDHQPEAVYLITPIGRITVAAYAAPKSPGQWREVVRELAESIRAEGAATRVEDGHWGREIVAEVPGEVHRFLGVDGPRWMLRCIASGPAEHDEHLAQLSRAVLAETVVRRGSDPFPPREPLPVVLPQILADQVASAQQEMASGGAFAPDNLPPGVDVDDLSPQGDVPSYVVDEQAVDAVDAPDDATAPPTSGSALQQLRQRKP